MIDFLHLKAEYFVSENELNPLLWHETETKTGERVYYHHHNGVMISYRPEMGKWYIVGKLIALIHDTQVLNVDDIYGADVQEFVNDINDYLRSLLATPMLDVLDFEVLRIDYCFNIKTPYVGEYLDVLARAFNRTNKGKRINYTQAKRLSGSIYIKTKSDYKANTRRNYVLNYYDKSNRLEYLREKGRPIADVDWKYAENVLRLEVQCGFNFIKQMCKDLKRSRYLGDLLSYDVAYYAHAKIYERVFKANSAQDYLTYQLAKKQFKNDTALKMLEWSAEGHDIGGTKFFRGRELVRNVGIYPYAFIPKGREVEVLANPLRLISEKIVAIGATEDCA